MISHIYTRVQAKARARQLKAESADPISLSAALEIVAKEMGFRDWNTASARLSNVPDSQWQVGERVSGTYLKRQFSGRIHGVCGLRLVQPHSCTGPGECGRCGPDQFCAISR